MRADECRGDRPGVEVRAALEAMAGVGVQAVAARGRRTTMGSNHAASTRTFLVSGVIIVSQPPMTPARPRGFLVIGDDEVVGRARALYAVESLEPLAFARAAHDDAAFDLVEIEGVRGLAHGEPCKVRGVDGVGDFFLLEKREVGRNFRAGNQSRESPMVMPRKTRAVKRPQASSASMRTENSWRPDSAEFRQRECKRATATHRSPRPRARCRSGSSRRRGWW
jgi:hypothetical protein